MAQYVRSSRRQRTKAQQSMARVALVVGALFVLTTAYFPAHAFEDVTPAERDAIAVRHMQTDMMVAALSCEMHDQYNAAVTRFQAELVQHGAALRALFERTYGSEAEQELNSYITRLANESSTRRIAAGADYCSTAANQFAKLESIPRTLLAAFSAGEVSVAAVPAAGPPPTREAALAR